MFAFAAVLGLRVLNGWAAEARAGDDRPPNILFIFADDQCFQTLGVLGNEEVQTPNLDRLARRGLVFRRCYNQGSWSGAVCVASRTMLNTGRYLWHAHDVYDRSEQERKAGRFWSEHLKRAGYETYFTGKWHVRADARQAFDVVRNVRGGMPQQTEAGYNRPLPDQPDPWSPWDPKFGGFWEGGKHWSEVVADDAQSFLARAAGRDAPFFMYLAFNAAHDPRQSPREFVERYPAESIHVPENYLPEYPYKDLIGCGRSLRDERLGPFPRTEHAVRVHRSEYYAIITHMDQQIGRILDALEQSGKADRTYIFFTADHGLAVGQHGLMGKQNMYEHSVRVPFLVAGPGVSPGTSDAPIYLQDVMPTTLELAGVTRPDHVEFQSLVPALRGQAFEGRDAIYGAYLELQRMVCSSGYKLILYPQAPRFRLYHLDKDPWERHDLADDPTQLPRARDLFARLLELQRQTGDALELRQLFPELAATNPDDHP